MYKPSCSANSRAKHRQDAEMKSVSGSTNTITFCLVFTATHAQKDGFRTYSRVVSPESESELLYDWRFTANQFVLATSPLRLTTSIFSIEYLLP
jgi:hypothetical protein